MVPGDKLALAQIGGCLTDFGEFGEAESYLRRALGGLEDGLTHYNLGLLLAQTNRLDEAVADTGWRSRSIRTTPGRTTTLRPFWHARKARSGGT